MPFIFGIDVCHQVANFQVEWRISNGKLEYANNRFGILDSSESFKKEFWGRSMIWGSKQLSMLDDGVIYGTTWSFEKCHSNFPLGVIYDTTWSFEKCHSNFSLGVICDTPWYFKKCHSNFPLGVIYDTTW
ncbi:hypothetical protein ACFE04_000072 [Oxalis oulophora]